ncbi:type II secretion system protein GspE [Desulfuromonas soudanensis]|uniref:protein-secreting ATPase n=1 Tax=Desulfuromonas soudanensis TaxID=1603606 RepID=A0A0M3QF30_9BACT|nr:type II secretion system ATPase GspE [Desulfuromonas soudanensis]ALC15363.1 type II secretion system protein GspE [Desulfuromonas soudanensis]
MDRWQPLGAILQKDHGVTAAQIDEALAAQTGSALRLGEILLETRTISAETLAQALAGQQGLPYMATIPPESGAGLLDLFPINFAKEYRIYPVQRDEGRLLVAVADPLDSRPLNDLATLTGEPVEICVATPEEILRAINRGYEHHAGEAQEFVEDIGGGVNLVKNLEPADLLDASDEAPVIRFVNSLITQGYKERASDIHIEPFEAVLIVRYRIDGILYEVLRPPPKAMASIISRIKIMANLNIAEKRLPQDGRFRVRIAGKDVDVRVSTLPTAFGERVVLRLLDKASNVLTLEEIGMADDLLRQVNAMITKSHGIFLVTGPTGSGKTTTLYAALSRLNSREKNIITVEDPIEYQLAGVGQIQVNTKIDLTFANGLRSILRQDPDIIMVGEIRDRETAEIAVQSALTGHMVFSTLHTNDAAGALTRLVEMGIEPFLAASSIVGILAQRLVRKICPDCRESYTPTPELLEEMGLTSVVPEGATFYRGAGCPRCMDIGYRGRGGIYEILPVDEKIRDLLLQNRDSMTIRNAAVARGMKTLRDSGISMALRGETTIEEVVRVTQEEV